MDDIRQELTDRISSSKTPADIWALHNYLTRRRDIIDRRYDYRYSVLIRVFASLIHDGYLELQDLQGLSADKIEILKRMVDEWQ